MSDLRIDRLESIDISTIHRVMTSKKLTENQKVEFFQKNRGQIGQVMRTQISSEEFKIIMEHRPLIKYRLLKNSYTKLGDKIILSKVLGIKPAEVPGFVNEVTEQIQNPNGVTNISKDRLKTIKQYVYRHGTKEQLFTFLDYELTNAADKLKVLYTTLEYHTGGVADYFVRPIHRLDNKTMVKLYKIIDKQLDTLQKSGDISQADNQKIAQWALIKIYEIQNNQKLIKAVHAYKAIKE